MASNFKMFYIYVVLLATGVLYFSDASAQARLTIRKGVSLVYAGAGLANSFGAERLGPAFRLSYEYCIADAGRGALTLGGIGGYSYQTYKNNAFEKNYSSIIGGVRFAFHYPWETSVFDTWIGLGGGVRYSMLSEGFTAGTLEKSNKIKPYFAGFVGLAYYFGRNFGLFAEGGYDFALVSGGLAIKF